MWSDAPSKYTADQQYIYNVTVTPTLVYYIWGGVRKSPDLKVPRHCPLVLPVQAVHMIGVNFHVIKNMGENAGKMQ
jgi:hypothetical protein